MSNFNKSITNFVVIVFSLVITSSIFIPPLFEPNLQKTLYPKLAFPFALFVFSSFVLGYQFLVRILNQNSFRIKDIFQKIAQPKFNFKVDKKILIISLTLSISFFFLYLAVGRAMLANIEFTNTPKLDFFGADVKDWTGLQYDRDGYKPAHTNILFIVQPLQFLLSFIPLPKFVLAVILNSLFSAVNIFLASILFWQITQRYLYTFLLTLFLGFTTSHLFFGSIPESYTLGSSSLITTYILLCISLKNKKINLALWLLAGIFSFGITITNFTDTMICFAIASFYIHNRMSHKERLLMILQYAGAVISCSIFLSLIQNKLYGSDYFFMPNMVVYETKSFIRKINLFTHPLLVVQELFKHFFLVNFVAPYPSIIDSYIYPGIRQLTFFGVPLSYGYVGFMAAVLWGYVFITGTYKNVTLSLARKDKAKIAFLSAVSLSILFEMIFHSMYGVVEMLIYTCYFTFLVMILFINNETLRKPYFIIVLGILIGLMAINNLSVLLSFQGYSWL